MREVDITDDRFNDKANVYGDSPGRCVIHFEANELRIETKLKTYIM